MRVGYACKNITLGKDGGSRTMTRKRYLELSYEDAKKEITNITIINLLNLKKMLEWNIKNNIYFMRISSDIIPLASMDSSLLDVLYDKDVLEVSNQILGLKREYNIRLSLHPGQYTVLNTKDSDVLENTGKDLMYHTLLAGLLGVDDMILHVGGFYGDKIESMKRFVYNFNMLPPKTKELLRVENDDKTYHIEDVLSLSEEINVPTVLDIHHDRCNPTYNKTIWDVRCDIMDTWHRRGLQPKLHISTGKDSTKDRSHSYLLSEDDIDLALEYSSSNIDIMVEAKGKELATIEVLKRLNTLGYNY